MNAKDLGNSGTWSLLLSPGPFRHLLNRFQLLYRQLVPPRCLSNHLLCHLSNSNVKWADQLLVPVVAQPVGPRIEAALGYLDQLHDVFGQGVDSIQPRKIQQVLKRSRNNFQKSRKSRGADKKQFVSIRMASLQTMAGSLTLSEPGRVPSGLSTGSLTVGSKLLQRRSRTAFAYVEVVGVI